jgi:hypothetical protein
MASRPPIRMRLSATDPKEPGVAEFLREVLEKAFPE